MSVLRSRRRRAVLEAGIGLGVGCAIETVAGGAFPLNDDASARPQAGDLLVRFGDSRKTPLTAEDIPLGEIQTMAWAMDPVTGTVRSGTRLNQLILLRLDQETLGPETRARAAAGVVAYTAICTHEGCDVDDWLADQQVLSCSCHFSTFDPRDGAKVVEGPAPRMLPALPLKIVDGKLAVAKPFTAPVGFGVGSL